MNVAGSGFIQVIIYSTFGDAIEQLGSIVTENNKDILTETDNRILG